MPNQKFSDVPLDLDVLLKRVRAKRPDIALETEFFVTLPPAKDCSQSAVAHALRRAHKNITNTYPKEGIGLFLFRCEPSPGVRNARGNYGPSGRTVTGKENWDPEIGEHLNIEDLTETAKVYTAVALDVPRTDA